MLELIVMQIYTSEANSMIQISKLLDWTPDTTEQTIARAKRANLIEQAQENLSLTEQGHLLAYELEKR
jgi:predicted transcriptional regulator